MKIYHNTRCSKSRQTLQIIRDAEIEPEIILYMDSMLSEAEIHALLGLLGITARQLMRRGEAEYKALGLDAVEDEALLIKAMSEHPRLIERPIVVDGNRAILCRPPENVMQFL